MTDFPMHEKMAAHRQQIDTVAEFLDTLEDQGLVICRWYDDTTLAPDYVSTTTRLATHFGIDQDVLEDEKRAMLHAQRVLNGNRALPEKIKEALDDAQTAG